MAASLHREASLLILNAEFEHNGLGQTPEGLANLMHTTERKPSEMAEQMQHRVYSRLYGIMWYGCKIGKGKFIGGQPTFVFCECMKKVVRAIVGENIKDYEDPVGSHVCACARDEEKQMYHVTLQDLANTKWPTAKRAKSKSKK